MNRNITCPNCESNYDVDSGKAFVFCRFCGTKINLAGDITSTPSTPQTNVINLIIHYITADPTQKMVTRIVETGVKKTYANGHSENFCLTLGKHTIVTKIAGKNINHTIYLQEGTVVTLYCSCMDSGYVYIDQPPVDMQRVNMLENEKIQRRVAAEMAAQQAEKDKISKFFKMDKWIHD